MALYEITITASKAFFVEAGNQEEALDMEVVYDEMTRRLPEINFDDGTATAKLCSKDDEQHVRSREPELILG